MSTFIVKNHNFSSTWAKMVPFLNSGKSLQNLCLGQPDWQTLKLLEAAQKAVYVFICKLCNQGAFKVGLDTQIKALDSENECEGDIGGSPWSAEMNQKINEFLQQLQNNPPSPSHCSTCTCKAFNNTPTTEQKEIVDAQIQSIYNLAQTYMKKEIGRSWLFCAKCLPCC